MIDLTAGAPVVRQNMLVNASFERWERGVGAFTGSGTFSADRWQSFLQGTSTLSVSRDSANADGGGFCAALTYVQNVNSTYYQRLEVWAELRGRVVTFAARVKTTSAMVRLDVYDGASKYFSPYHSGSGAYETLAVTALVPAGATAVHAEVDLSGSATVYLDNATLAVGERLLEFTPEDPATELRRCQRCYQEYGAGHSEWMLMQVYNAGAAMGAWTYPVEMAGVPTITYSALADWSVYKDAVGPITLTSLAFNAPTKRSTRVTASVAAGMVAGNAIGFYSPNAVGRLRAESNP